MHVVKLGETCVPPEVQVVNPNLTLTLTLLTLLTLTLTPNPNPNPNPTLTANPNPNPNPNPSPNPNPDPDPNPNPGQPPVLFHLKARVDRKWDKGAFHHRVLTARSFTIMPFE